MSDDLTLSFLFNILKRSMDNIVLRMGLFGDVFKGFAGGLLQGLGEAILSEFDDDDDDDDDDY